MQHDDAKKFWNSTYKTRAMVSTIDFAEKSWGYLQSKSNIRLLDVGCGDGRDSLFFHHHGCFVQAIDYSAEAIRRVRKLDAGIDADVMDITNMNFADETFDAVYAHLSIHYFDDATTEKIIDDIYRILEPTGYFFVRCKSIHDPLYGKGEKVGEDMYAHDHVRHFFSEEYMKLKLRQFTILEICSTQDVYDGKTSAFVEAIAQK